MKSSQWASKRPRYAEEESYDATAAGLLGGQTFVLVGHPVCVKMIFLFPDVWSRNQLTAPETEGQALEPYVASWSKKGRTSGHALSKIKSKE